MIKKIALVSLLASCTPTEIQHAKDATDTACSIARQLPPGPKKDKALKACAVQEAIR